MKVTDASDDTVSDTSNNNFTIKGSLTLNSPNGAETWVVATSHDITWTKQGTMSSVKLEYSTNGFSDELETVTIVASTDSTGTPAGTYKRAWTIPDAIFSTVKVRITNNDDSSVTDRSDTNFKITGSFTLTAPNGGNQWTVNTIQDIRWTFVGTILNAKLEYSTDGSTYPNIILASTPAGGLAYSWTIPDAISTTCKVKVSDASDFTVFDVSDANFAIRGKFTITSPNGGQDWVVGTSQNITWDTVGSVENVKLEYSTDGGTTYPNVIIASTPNAGTYGWSVPNSICNTAKVKVSDVNNDQAFDISDNNFKIRGAFTITAPNGAEQWVVNTSENITWATTGTIANVKLQYSTNGFSDELETVLIIASTPNNNTYPWTIPDAIGSTLKVRVTNVNDSNVYDVSNANFIIKGSVNLTVPDGGEIWIVGATEDITWTKTGTYANVKLEYSKNGFSDELETVVITPSTPVGNLSYPWAVADAIGTSLKVRVTDVDNSTVTDMSLANFEIKGSLTLASPNGTEIWKVNESRNITWTKTGSIANVKLEYSINGGTSYPNTIVASTDATTGSYPWTIPDAIGTALRVKITNVLDSAVTDTSNANFEIKGGLTVTSPNGGETWVVQGSQPINWSRAGSIANVKLEYSTNGGSTYPNLIIASTPAGSGSYPWTIPDAISTTLKVKITNVDDADVFDVSNDNFTIVGSLTLTAPDGGESWVINTSQDITWTRTGSISSVKLEYSTNGGSTYPNVIIASTNAATGIYPWTIPDAPSTLARVKITNTADSSVFDNSSANFRIRGLLTLTSPNGTEIWIVSSSHDITWTRQGSIPNAKLEYSTDGGGNYPNVITASTPAANLSYPWSVPDAIGASLRVKISDVDDATVYDTSNANFEIKGSLTLTVPNGAEVWKVGESRNITWTKTGAFANVKLEYSTNGGSSYPNVIVASTDATAGTYPWTVADAIGVALRVKITNTLDSAVADTSNANFEIKGVLVLTAPNGGEAWVVTTSNNITWNRTGSIANVKLEYSADGGSSYPNTIIASTPASASYPWTIPDAIGDQIRVKVTDVLDETVTDASNANFKITGSFTLTSPNGGEVWIVGENHNITWTKNGSIANAKLEYSTNGGTTYPNVITPSIGAGSGSYTWTMPDDISSTLRVKISDTTDATVFDTSNANFKIAGSFILTSPNGGEKWPIGSTQAITWTKSGSIINAKLEYSTNGGTTYPNVIIATTPASSLSYSWTAVDNNPSVTCRVKISDFSDSTVFDTSNADFKIHGTFNLASPNGGEVWTVQETRNITWTANGSIPNVKLEYSTNGGLTYPNTIIASTPNTLSYSWTIPDAIGTTLRVKITDILDSDATDTSNGNFKIRGAVTLTAPNGGEAWIVSTLHNITWVKTGSIANVKLEYSTDSGQTYPVGNVIVSSVAANLGTYEWTIPDKIYTTVRVKISDVTDSTVVDESNSDFIIRGGFTVTAPNGAEKWTVGTSQNITWTTFGTIYNVKLEYSTNGGSTYPNVIIASTSNTGTYPWTIPNAIFNNCRVRVSNAADSGTFDTSDANFKIMGGFTVSTPDGGEVWAVNESRNIIWNTAGTVSLVKLEYSTNSGSTYPYTIIASTPNNNSFSWTVADAISATLRMRVSDANDSDAFDTSNGNFKIRAGFNVTSPNGGETWIVASSHNITWATYGTVANVKLEYSTDGGSTYPPANVIIGSTGNTGTYPWPIPDAIGTALRVKVSDATDSTALDASNNNFEVKGSLILTAPNGGEKWIIGDYQSITWTKTGSINNVKLEYSLDAGVTYPNLITASTTNPGTYGWTIPDAASTLVRVRVTNNADGTVKDESDANLKIQPSFTITAPNGGEKWGIGEAKNITWTTSGTVPTVKLMYSTDGGVTYPPANLITSSTSNLGTYQWTIPDAISATVRVRVEHTSDPEAFDQSNANFRIRSKVTVTSPNSGLEEWEVGQTYNITWTVQGTIPTVKIEYSTNAFSDENEVYTVIASTPNDGTHPWTIPVSPDPISKTVRVRVSDYNDFIPPTEGAYDFSNYDFKIKSKITVTSPNGAEKWDVGSTYNITWTCAGTVSEVKIEWSKDGGTTYPYSLTVPNTSPYSWQIPNQFPDTQINTITNGYLFKIRISDADAYKPTEQSSKHPVAFDVSDASAKIKAPFTITSPNGSEVWTTQESHPITWTWTGIVPNVKLEYSTNGGTTYPNIIIGSTANTGTYNWTIPDAISTTVKVRVTSVDDSEAFDVSDANFKIRGALQITAPNGLEPWEIGNTFNITWNTTGTIPNVKLVYSIDSGVTYPYTITNSVSNTGTYSWAIPDVPNDTPTHYARVKISNVSDSTVSDESNADFDIRGYLLITSPNGNEQWIVGTAHNITWNKGGRIGYKLSYSLDGGMTYPNVITTVVDWQQNTGTYSWVVPDDISQTVKVKIQDPANPDNVFDVSNNNFTICGSFVLSSPNGAERWVTSEERLIEWSAIGTMPQVKLEYSKDNFNLDRHTIVAALDIPDPSDPLSYTGAYNWEIPDAVLKDVYGIYSGPDVVKVRISDATDSRVYDDSNNTFTIDYYKIIWYVRNLTTNEHVSNLSVREINSQTEEAVWVKAALASSEISPITHWTPAGSYTTTWSAPGFGDKAENYAADQNRTITVFMETTAIHIWRSYSEFAYTASDDRLDVSSWLERDGAVVSGVSAVKIDVYDAGNVIKTLQTSSPNPAGFFNLTWNSTGLVAGKVYTTITDITNVSGAHFKTPGSFEITTPKSLADMQATVNSVLDKPISVVSAEIQESLQDQTDLIDDRMTEQTNIITEKTNTMETMIQTTMKSFEDTTKSALVELEEGAKKAVAAGNLLTETALKYSWNAVVSPDPVLLNDKAVITCQGQPGLEPVLEMYSNDDKVIVQAEILRDPITQGIYKYEFTADGRFTPGQAYTYIITERETDAFITGSGMVESMGLTTIAGLAAAAPEAARVAKKALEAIKAVEAVVVTGENINIALTLKNLKESVDALPGALAKEGPSTQLVQTVNEISDRIRSLAGEEGFDLSTLLEEALSGSPTIKDMRTKTDAINSVIELLMQIFEAKLGGLDSPVISTSLQPGSVKFRVVALNPSKLKTQKIQVKTYLPEEVKPKDIMDLGGLELEYDAEKSIYYVYRSNIELAPGEMRSFEVEVEDIWFVPEKIIGDLRTRANAILERLDKTEYYVKAKEIADTIYPRLDEIIQLQLDDAVSRQQHIGIYRQNLLTIEQIKEDLAKMEKIIVTAGGPPAPEMLATNVQAEAPSKTMTWIVIFIIIIFVGLLAAVLFFTWQRQARTSQRELLSSKRSAFPGPQDEEKKESQ
ncbi:MAG: hypothetical protein NTW64_04490 [Candidatus Omnitrophica bacterium]|nr:hypothetical protein [Candidatus Omnitrophota bacterium]